MVPAISTAEPGASSALVLYDFGIEPPPAEKWEPVKSDTVTHEAVRRFGPAREQMDRFLRPGGVVEDPCDGEPCFVPSP